MLLQVGKLQGMFERAAEAFCRLGWKLLQVVALLCLIMRKGGMEGEREGVNLVEPLGPHPAGGCRLRSWIEARGVPQCPAEGLGPPLGTYRAFGMFNINVVL